MRKAFLRYLSAPSLQRALNHAAGQKWDSWPAPEAVRYLVYIFSIAGGAAPAFLLSAVVLKLWEDKSLMKEYKKNKRKFILECARLERCVPIINFLANEHGEVEVFGEKLHVPDGTHLHASIQNANRDGKCLNILKTPLPFCIHESHLSAIVRAFGPDAAIVKPDRDPAIQYQQLTFNGNENDIKLGASQGRPNFPVRRCPGWGIALDIIEFLVDRYAPPPDADRADELISDERMEEVKSRQSKFMSQVLDKGVSVYNENNKYFPHASEVRHPLDTKGRPPGHLNINVCGSRQIPKYGK